MFLCDIVDKLLDEHGLSYARTTEEADFSSLEVRLQKVDDLDSGEENLLRGLQILEFRRLAVDRQFSLAGKLAKSVDSIARDIHHATSDLGPGRH